MFSRIAPPFLLAALLLGGCRPTQERVTIAAAGQTLIVEVARTEAQRERGLMERRIKLNVTAMLTLDQVSAVAGALENGAPSNVSVFAGRIADTGSDPVPIMEQAVQMLRSQRQIELIWASPRELLNVFQADAIGCHIVTATPDILKKLSLVGKDPTEYSLETVRMFFDDAAKSGFRL